MKPAEEDEVRRDSDDLKGGRAMRLTGPGRDGGQEHLRPAPVEHLIPEAGAGHEGAAGEEGQGH